MMQTGIVIIDLEADHLTQEEREILQHPVVAGVILFSRNYENVKQLQQLCSEIKRIKPTLFIAVDQEGGRVQRFQDGFTRLPPMSHWGIMYQQDAFLAKRELQAGIETMLTELQTVGVNMNLIPVLDLNYGISRVIGERSLHANPDVVIELARMIIETLHRFNMPAVGKHFPGHGAVALDSHIGLPLDPRDWPSIQAADLKPFIALTSELDAIMPAHVIYSAIDKVPATFSYQLLTKLLRHEMDYQGVIISDDLSMEAAAVVGNYANRANYALDAGCDLLLVCNNRNGAIAIIDAIAHRHPNVRSQQRVEKYIRNIL